MSVLKEERTSGQYLNTFVQGLTTGLQYECTEGGGNPRSVPQDLQGLTTGLQYECTEVVGGGGGLW